VAQICNEFLCRYCIVLEFVALPIKLCNSNAGIVICFLYPFVAFSFTSKLMYCLHEYECFM